MNDLMSDLCDEDRFVERLQHGDPAAHQTLLDKYSQEVREGILMSLSKKGLPHEYADEIEQSTWETVFDLIHTFQADCGSDKFGHWIRVISHKHVQTLAKHNKKMRRLAPFDEAEMDHSLITHNPETEEVDNPENRLILEEEDLELEIKGAQVSEVVYQYLSEREQTILERRANGEKYTEIAADYDLTADAIRKIVERARLTVQRQLKLNGKG